MTRAEEKSIAYQLATHGPRVMGGANILSEDEYMRLNMNYDFKTGYEEGEKDILDDAKQVVASFEQAFKQAEKDLGWISVKDRLPEKDGFYLTCVNQAGVAQCVGLQYFDTNLMKWRDFDEEVREVFIDYWMEIPKLPKEEEKK